MIVRQARPAEAEKLSAVAMRSKAHWGYDGAFMEACRAALTMSEEKITRHHVCLAEEGDVIAGFCCLIADGENGILDDLFVDPPFIGKGCGRLLWDSILRLAETLGIREITIDADPNAEGFYLKMGAERVGDVASTVFPDRKLPLLKLNLRRGDADAR